MPTIVVNGKRREMTPAEIADHNAKPQANEPGMRVSLKSFAESEAEFRMEAIAPANQRQRAIAKGASLNRKKTKHLQNPATSPDLSPDEELLAENLESLQEATEAIREAGDTIVAAIDAASGQDLIDFDVETRPEWP